MSTKNQRKAPPGFYQSSNIIDMIKNSNRNRKSTNVYLITVITGDSLVLREAFEDIDDALLFEKNCVKKQLRDEYGDKMADSKDLCIGFSTVQLHKSTTLD